MSYSRRTAAGVRLHVITADLRNPRVVVSPALAAGGIGTSETFSAAMRRLGPVAAVNGTYFDKKTLRPVGDIVIGGRLVYFGGTGTAIAIAKDGVDCIRLPKSRRLDWTGYRSALAAGPLLVWDGFPKPLPGGEGFRDPHVFANSARRTAVGITENNKLLLVTSVSGCSLPRLARAMKELGAVYAVNLDGGASAAMWYHGKQIRRPGRRLTNFLCVYVKPEPAGKGATRPPRGLDWRPPGNRPGPTPVIGFRVGDLRVWAELPRKWRTEQSIAVKCEGALPSGSLVRVELNGGTIALLGGLPAEVPVRLTDEKRAKHQVWIGLVDEDGEILGSARRVFDAPGPAE